MDQVLPYVYKQVWAQYQLEGTYHIGSALFSAHVPKHKIDIRPRLQAGAVCVHEKTRKDRNTKVCSMPRGAGSGEVTTS
jgi:hypothetical protein